MSLQFLRAHVPAIGWLQGYRRDDFPKDLTAGIITAVLLVPQGMAYALLAGLPPEVGLYASILPPLIYALLGTSRTLSVGPVSVAALLVADALARSGQLPGEQSYFYDALLLAAMSGTLLLLMALLRLDILVNFLGHPVLSGFTSAAAVLIILAQLESLLGIPVARDGSGVDLLLSAVQGLGSAHLTTSGLGLVSIALLLVLRSPLTLLLQRLGLSERKAALVSRSGPLAVVVILTALVATLGLQQNGVQIIGAIPAGFPAAQWDFLRPDRLAALLPSAVVISLIGYVESVSIAKVLAYRRREKIDNRQELIALGAANVVAAFSGAMPVAGGFSRSIVNFSAGAVTQLAAVITAALVAVITALFTQWFFYLPKATLAAIIMVAVVPLLDWRGALKTFRYDPADGSALLVTFVGVLMFGIEVGLAAGVSVGIGTFVWRSSRPHVAVVGRLPGTEHFRNVKRHEVQTWPHLVLLRIDRSLYFANVNYIGDEVAEIVHHHEEIRDLVILCGGINEIDHSAVEALEQMAESLRPAGVTLHLAEVKGPVMDRLKRSNFLEELAPGRVFLSADEAVRVLTEGNARLVST